MAQRLKRLITNSPYRVGKWLPSDQAALNEWLRKLIEKVDGKRRPEDDLTPDELLPVVQKFKDTVEGEAELLMFFTLMFEEVPFPDDPTGEPSVKDYKQMFRLMSAIIQTAPEYNETGLVRCPLNAVLNWSMATVNGYAAYLHDTVNAQFKNVFDHWENFLKSPGSRYVLTDREGGWFSDEALAAMPGFSIQFQCDPSKPHYGFQSWDDFFVRKFRPYIRPIAAPDDDRVIVNACESAPYKLQRDVQLRDEFWIKAQKYSLLFMLNDEAYAKRFVGGTVYQAFLSALNYHRWHSPVDGTIVKVDNIPGTYYSETLAMQWDPAGPTRSQGYICEVAARAAIYIQANNPDIGLMCVLTVGMVEVSSCDVTVSVGQSVKKGDEIGMFHFGGSTHCLIFRRGVDVEFDLGGQTPGLDTKNILINSLIATVPGVLRGGVGGSSRICQQSH